MTRPGGDPVIDSHVHFWDPDRLRYPWLDGETQLRRTFTPEDLRGLTVEGYVFVQAETLPEQAADEVAWVRSLAAAGAPVLGVVARAALERGAACEPELASYAADPLVVGVRRLLQDEPDGFALRSAFLDAVRALPDHGLTFDLCVRENQLDEVCRLVRLCPEVRFVLDHLGKPAVDPAGPAASPWSARIDQLSDSPNVWCKLSGLASEARPADRTPAAMLPYLAHVLETFGPDRCLFGSDWPVSGLVVGHRTWYDLVGLACDHLAADDRAKVFAGNAVDVYGLGGRKEDDAWHSPTRRSSGSRR